MKNRFKVKAFLKEKKCFYDVIAFYDDYVSINCNTKWVDQFVPLKDVILVQCTGMRAASSYRGWRKKDQLIFEDDIIQTKNGSIFSVTYVGDEAKFVLNNKFITNFTQCSLKEEITKKAKIIGNIHEHPHLLKK